MTIAQKIAEQIADMDLDTAWEHILASDQKAAGGELAGDPYILDGKNIYTSELVVFFQDGSAIHCDQPTEEQWQAGVSKNVQVFQDVAEAVAADHASFVRVFEAEMMVRVKITCSGDETLMQRMRDVQLTGAVVVDADGHELPEAQVSFGRPHVGTIAEKTLSSR